MEAAQTIVGTKWDDVAETIARLPGALGGCGLRMLDTPPMAAASFWATWVRHKKILPGLAEQTGRPLVEIAGQEAADKAKQTLEQAGLYVEEDGGVQMTKEAADLWATCRWSKDRSAEELMQTKHMDDAMTPAREENPADATSRKVLGRIWRGLEAIEAAKLWQKLDEHDRNVWYDGGGQGAGSIWCAAQHGASTPQAPVWFADAHFALATATRTMALRLPATATCNLVGKERAGDQHSSSRWGETMLLVDALPGPNSLLYAILFVVHNLVNLKNNRAHTDAFAR